MDILLSAECIQERVAELAKQIAADYRGQPALTIVGVLTGSLMFLADLVRHLDLPLRIGFIQASSYRGASTTPGLLRISPDLVP
ncbi:MAG TPA: phosphoribosyltransferase family protein, partial [Candidatus Solibacter sp.]|nr:phosphoribosyltransferase family protein [Candidatus Solibacter sp.]